MKKPEVIYILAVFFLCFSATVYADDNLVAWWSFDQNIQSTVLDQTGQLDDPIEGTFTPVTGVIGQALRFDGYTTAINRPADQVPSLGNKFTIEAWIAQAAYPWNWCPIICQNQQQQAGYNFALGPRGQVTLQLAVNGQWHTCTSGDWDIPLGQWIHVAGTYDSADGLAIYANGQKAQTTQVRGAPQFANDADLKIGANYDTVKPSNIHREHGTKAWWFSLDGIVDEIKIYNRSLTDQEIQTTYAAQKPTAPPDLPPRVMPSGPKGPGRFGAYYSRLKYYPEWDNLWAVDSDPDVLVRFDNTSARMVFWRGSRFSPAWVSENDQWMADQSVEAWEHGENDAEGCFEHMQDYRCRYSHVRVIESHPARAVVHWRYALLSSSNNIWRENEKTGRGCWIDEYYYIYPDAMAVRKPTWKTGTLGRPRQFQESLPFTHAGQLQSDVINTDFAWVGNLAGQNEVLSFVKNPDASTKKFPDNLTIQMYNFKAQNKPFIIFEPGNRMNYVNDRRLGPRGLDVPGACNHWPVGQMLCDGRTVQAADRPTHFLGFPISSPPVHQKNGRSWWNGLYGMTDKSIDELTVVARSWSQPPQLNLKSQGFSTQGYDRSERAYQLTCENPNITGVLECEIAASENSPIYNIPMVIKNWGYLDAELEINGQKIKQGPDFRTGHRYLVEGSNLIVWIKFQSTEPVTIILRTAK
ncbi:MAG: LamG domain-containing protein [Planctomycetes bacterium]|nr:LamG domain-containing protein [Planctomycetota bacterium]